VNLRQQIIFYSDPLPSSGISPECQFFSALFQICGHASMVLSFCRPSAWLTSHQEKAAVKK